MLHDLDTEIFVANEQCVEAEQVYRALRRRGFSERKADAISGRSKCERALNRLADKRLDRERAIVVRKLKSLPDLQEKVAILVRWEQRGIDVALPLAAVATALLAPGSLTDR